VNIVFAGTPAFAVPCLQALYQSEHHLSGIYTQPDRPAGRGRKLQASAVKQFAVEHQLPIFQPERFNTPESLETLKALAPDIMVVIAYGLILPKAVLDIPRFLCINVHASLLPRFRGAAPIQYALLNGDAETGVTIMQMDVGMDTGPMLLQRTCPIERTDTATSLHNKLMQLAIQPLLSTIDTIQKNTVQITPQPTVGVTYAPKINKTDAKIDWSQSTNQIDQAVRAYNPWPIAYTLHESTTIRIHQGTPKDLPTKATPGTILAIDKQGILVATGDGTYAIEILQFPDRNPLSIAQWLNANPLLLHIGTILQ
jgi:methionyl-tRNA formyltransferase